MSLHETPSSFKNRDLFWLALLFLMVGALFVPNLIQGLSAMDGPEVADVAYQWMPFKVFLAKVFRLGSFPLWDPHNLCGMPFLAFSHTGSLYPFGVPIYTFASFHLATSFYIFFHLLISAFCMYLFLRHIPCQALTAFLGATAYTFSGFLFGSINYIPTLATGSWLPLILLGIHLLIQEKKSSGFLICALATLLSMLGGDIETLLYSMMGVFYYALVLGYSNSFRSTSRSLILASLAIGTGILLSFAQFLPLLELNHFSVRAGTFTPKLAFLDSWWLPLALSGLFFYPVPQPESLYPPNHGLDPFYLGFIFFPFFILALSKNTSSRARQLSGFFLLVLAYLILMFAPAFHGLASRIPIFREGIVPLKFMPIVEIYFFCIAARGIDKFLLEPEAHPRFQKSLLVYFIAYGALVIAASLVIKQDLIPRLALSGILVSFPLWRRRIAISIALLIFAIMDTYVMAWVHLPRTGHQGLRVYPELESLITDTGVHDRYFILAIRGIIDPQLPFNLGMRIQADTIDSWSRVPPRRQAEALAMILPGIFHLENERLVSYDQMAIRDQNAIRPEGIPLFSLLNVRWFISPYPWNPPLTRIRLREIAGTLLNIYENEGCLPRAFIVHRYRRFPDYESLRRAMEQGKFDMAGEVLLIGDQENDQRAAEFPVPGNAQAERVTLKRPRPDQLFASVSLLEDGYIFLSESWYPGWEISVDGEPARIEIANYAFRAVRLEAGKHELDFSYQPLSFRMGLWTSIASLICFIGFTCILANNRKKISP